MKQIIDLLDTDLANTLNYWQKHIYSNSKKVYGEISCSNVPEENADIGSMFLSRIIYGASTACKSLSTNTYKDLADSAIKVLFTELKNPEGGFYWSLDKDGNPLHDSENINMAQAFVLYGLAEYLIAFPSKMVEQELKLQLNFILDKIRDHNDGGYIDGFDMNWNAKGEKSRYFGTHIHLLEAFTKIYEYNNTIIEVSFIEELIKLILERFIDSKSGNRIHQVGENWESLPGNIWAGHNAECSWILCYSAEVIKNTKLIEACEQLAVKQMDNVMDLAYDKKYGGVFNELKNGKPIEENKMWWPQAETALGLLNAYKITNNTKYYQLACDLIEYIRTYFLSIEGEWYTAVSIDGKANLSIPKINFWKSLYHNVRYYVEAKSRLIEINSNS